MGRNKRPSVAVRIDDDILVRLEREWPNGGTRRERVRAALLFALDNKDYTPVKLLGRIDELVKGRRKRRK